MPSQLQKNRTRAFHQQASRCYYCNVCMWSKTPLELTGYSATLSKGVMKLRSTAEHCIPRSEGGGANARNIVAACWHCNMTRHKSKSPLDTDSYRIYVRKRILRQKWHPAWVYSKGWIS